MKRYDINSEKFGNSNDILIQSENGDYVLYEDYKKVGDTIKYLRGWLRIILSLELPNSWASLPIQYKRVMKEAGYGYEATDKITDDSIEAAERIRIESENYLG